MSSRFFQVSCGFAGFWTENPKNDFTVEGQGKIRSETPQAGPPPDFSGRRPRFFALSPSSTLIRELLIRLEKRKFFNRNPEASKPSDSEMQVMGSIINIMLTNRSKICYYI